MKEPHTTNSPPLTFNTHYIPAFTLIYFDSLQEAKKLTALWVGHVPLSFIQSETLCERILTKFLNCKPFPKTAVKADI